jgi:ADP-ribosylglycohydrolase
MKRGVKSPDPHYIGLCYKDWLQTQEKRYSPNLCAHSAWLANIPELYSPRAPGNTCLAALRSGETGTTQKPINDSKGCGGVMRVAPAALFVLNDPFHSVEKRDMDAAQMAAVTHGHSLGYMPAAVLSHIITRLVSPETNGIKLKDAVLDARDTLKKLFADDENTPALAELIDLAAELSENGESDLDNIHALGEGWVGEEAMAVGVYCALRYRNDFAAGIRAAVNHCGDSDSTGAVCGNILGAWLGDRAVGREWKDDLELEPLIREIGGRLAEYSGK